MNSDLITGARLGDVRDYDWFRERRRQQLAPLAGTKIAVTPDSTASPICGRLLDSSVMVGGLGGLPIENGAVGIAALGGTAYPAPTWTGSVSVTPSSTALSTDVVVQATLNNVPQDGNCASLLWVFRRNGQSTWTPWAETPLSGLPTPPAAQVQSFGFGDLTSGLAYDFGAAYVTANGAYGAIAILESDYAVPVVAIPSSYMLGGTTVTPTFANVTHAIGTSVNGISTPLTLDWTCTNQPTDGSLSRVTLWIRQNGTTAWTIYASLAAVGVNSSSPPASGAYAFTFTDLTNGLSYDFGLSYENAQGGEGNVAAVASNVAMPVVGPSASAKMSAALLASGPHISSATVGSFNNAGTATPSLPIGVTFTDWTSGTLPTWLLGVRFYIRAHGTTNPQPMGDQTTSGRTTIDVTLGLAAATTIDIGCSYIDNASEESAIAWPGGAWNAVSVPAIGPNGIDSLGGPNLIPDSQFAYATFGSNGIAGNDPYWNFYLIDGISFFIGRGGTATGSNYLGVRPGNSGKLCKAQSEVITAQPNTLYTVSAYIDATTCSGTSLPYIAIVSTDQSVEYARASQIIGKSGVVSAQYTTPAAGGPTQLTAMFNSNNCTISTNILVFQEPHLQVGQLGPYTPGPSVSGGAATNPPPSSGSSGGGAADPGSGSGDGGGYHKNKAMPYQVRGAVADDADEFGSYLRSGTVHRGHLEVVGQAGSGNLVYNPTGSSGLNGWTRHASNGNQLPLTTDGFDGSRFITTPGTLIANSYDGYKMSISVVSNVAMILGVKLSANVPVNCYAYVDVYGEQSGTSLASIVLTNTNVTRLPQFATLNTGANTSVTLRWYLWNKDTVSHTVSGDWSKFQLEYGTQPSPWVDHYAASGHNKIFDGSQNMRSSAIFKTYVPNSLANLVSNITVQTYSASAGALVIWLTGTTPTSNPGNGTPPGSNYPSWTYPDLTGGVYPGYKNGAAYVCGTGSGSPAHGLGWASGLPTTSVYIGIAYDISADLFSVVYGPSATQPTDAQIAQTVGDGNLVVVLVTATTGDAIPTGGGGGHVLPPGGGGHVVS